MKPSLLSSSALSLVPLCALLLAGCTSYEPAPRHAVGYRQPGSFDVLVVHSVDDFYEPLSPYGEWVVVGSYGRCWRPTRVATEWRPYSDGRWVRADAGWYWESAEPWGWATYHYGRWDFDVSFGWLWFPETHWAPAWVEWRSGGGYVGWAPMPPAHRHSHFREHEDRYFVFVPEPRFVEPIRPQSVIVNNTTIVQQTVNIRNTTRVNNTVINEGPRVDVIEKASGRKVSPVPVTRLRHTQEAEVVAKHPTLSRDRAKAGEQPVSTQVERPSKKAESTRSPRPEPQPRRAETTQPSTPAPASPRREERPAEVRKETKPTPANRDQDTDRVTPPPSRQEERRSQSTDDSRSERPEPQARKSEVPQPLTPAPASPRREERPSEVRKETKPAPTQRDQDTDRVTPPPSRQEERRSQPAEDSRRERPEPQARKPETAQPQAPAPASPRREERPAEVRRESKPAPVKAAPSAPQEKKQPQEKKPKKDDEDKGGKP